VCGGRENLLIASWKNHLYRIGTVERQFDEAPAEPDEHRREIEPWLSAVFQSEHLSLLVGNGLTTAVAAAAGGTPTSMSRVEFSCELETEVNAWAEKSAVLAGRGEPNIEDQLRSALQLMGGLEVLGDARLDEWRSAIRARLASFAHMVLATERSIADAIRSEAAQGIRARSLLVSFLLSFASRSASRERLHAFTTNYDRLIEHGCDLVGLRPLDRFVGALAPVFRASRLDVDMHYNPPGIRGEPRYLEGVIRLTKLHGSLDWAYESSSLRRTALPFAASDDHPALQLDPLASLMIYPNSAKDLETVDYPYAELFRDFSAALCRPNSTLVTYGYGFGDEHVNRVILDMLTIPSTHLVVMSYDDCGGRLETFLERASRSSQISLLVGSHFADLPVLVRHYLPKPAIDTLSTKRAELLRKRDVPTAPTPQPTSEAE
jgi:hypothetical protein